MKYDNLLKTLFYETMPGLLRAMGCAPVEEYMTVEFPSRPKMGRGRRPAPCTGAVTTTTEQWEESEIVQIVVYLGNGLMTTITRIQRPKCDYNFEVLDMRDIPAEIFLDSPNDAERVLALLCQSAVPRETIRRVLASWKHLPGNMLLENLERLPSVKASSSSEGKRDSLPGVGATVWSPSRVRAENGSQKPRKRSWRIGDCAFVTPRASKTSLPADRSITVHQMLFDIDIPCHPVFLIPGEARLLTRMLERQFGQKPRFEEVDNWADQFYEASNPDDIFAA